MIAALFSSVGLALSLQTTPQITVPTTQEPRPPATFTVPLPTDTSATAVRAAKAPTIDGKDDDEVWQTTPPISAFKQWRPNEDKPPRYKTEAKIAYDASNLYVFVRAFDPHPDSIKKLLERRDRFTPSDMIWIFVDSYHDKRTGYEFGVNAAGVKIDQAIYDDGNEDGAWDAVWDVKTQVDSAGWTAEYQIPLSQLRYGGGRERTFGIMIDRTNSRYTEREMWPLLRQSKPGFVSQFGTLHGLEDLEEPRKLEAVPYVVTKSASKIVNNAFAQKQNIAVGADVKYRIAPNLTLDATINPDFGQVESDPAVLNLTAFESFFDERRPFFVAGRGLFSQEVNCSAVNCSGENLFYSRRIGRTPQLAGIYGDTVAQDPVTILGAAKLIGRWQRGLTLGVLDAVTQREASPGDTTFSPATNFAVVRATQDFRKGSSSIGAMVTAVHRRLDEWSTPYLASNALASSFSVRHRFLNNMYQVSAALDHSRVQGSPQTMLSLQRSGVHNYQRPDADLPLDSSRTVLSGDAQEFKFGKIAGRRLNFETSYMRRSPGFDVNDLGFLRRADQISWNNWVGFSDRQQRRFYNSFRLNNNWWQFWTADGLPQQRAYNTNMHVTFRNNSGVSMGGTLGQLGKTYDDRAARGGPAVRQDRYIAPWMNIFGDNRKSIVPYIYADYRRGDGGRSRSVFVSPSVDLKLFGRMSSSLGLNWSHNIDDKQPRGVRTDATGTHYTFAHLDQHTTSLTARVNYTFTPDISLQTYLQPFVSKGTYSNVRELSATPRADAYDDRYVPYVDPGLAANPGFNFKQMSSNVVFRWEYKPGSTFFAVWNQGRQGSVGQEGSENFMGDVRDVFSLHPVNTFLIKVSYWLNR
jgi:hypothetical protein